MKKKKKQTDYWAGVLGLKYIGQNELAYWA